MQTIRAKMIVVLTGLFLVFSIKSLNMKLEHSVACVRVCKCEILELPPANATLFAKLFAVYFLLIAVNFSCLHGT